MRRSQQLLQSNDDALGTEYAYLPHGKAASRKSDSANSTNTFLVFLSWRAIPGHSTFDTVVVYVACHAY